jgi:hypothetical protein
MEDAGVPPRLFSKASGAQCLATCFLQRRRRRNAQSNLPEWLRIASSFGAVVDVRLINGRKDMPLNVMDSSVQSALGSGLDERFKSPVAQLVQKATADAVEFDMWASKQATSLAKLKIFHTMAKQVNDQQ